MLSSWKEIAHFFGKGVRTVQRWEKTLDLPIHRPPGAPSNVVLARTSDLEEWMHRGSVNRTEHDELSGDAILESIPALERELAQLASTVGVAVEPAGAMSSEERLVALTETVSRIRQKFSVSGSASRAA